MLEKAGFKLKAVHSTRGFFRVLTGTLSEQGGTCLHAVCWHTKSTSTGSGGSADNVYSLANSTTGWTALVDRKS